MADVCRVLLVSAVAVTATVAAPGGLTWYHLVTAGQPQQPPLPPQLVLLLVDWHPGIGLPNATAPEATAPPYPREGETESPQNEAGAEQQSEYTTATSTAATADTSAAVVARAVMDTTTRVGGLPSFINAPDLPCPEGQKRGPAGNCRDIW